MKKITQYLIAGAAIVIIIAGLRAGAGLINQILMSFLLAICISPLPEWLSRKGLSKSLSIAISLIIILVGGFLTIVLLANSISGLVDSFPAYQQKLTEIFNKFSEFAASNNLNISELIQKVHITPEKVIEFGGKLAGSLTSIISSSFIIAMLVVFIVIELVGYTVDTRKGRRDQISLDEWLRGMSGDLRKYITITALKGVITAALNFVFLLIFGIDFAFLWAFFSFLMNFVPNLGFLFSLIPPALIALITLGPWQALVVIIAFWLINFVVENVIGPIFMKKSLDVSLLSSFLSLLVWGWILGMPGAILGIPLTMVVMKIYTDSKKWEIKS